MSDDVCTRLMSEAELKEILGGMVSVRLRDGSFRDVGDKLRAHIAALERQRNDEVFAAREFVGVAGPLSGEDIIAGLERIEKTMREKWGDYGVDILAAARAHPLALKRRLPGGKTIAESIAAGGNGTAAALSLLELLRSEGEQRAALTARFKGRSALPTSMTEAASVAEDADER